MDSRSGSDANADTPPGPGTERDAVAEGRDQTTVACPHSGCERTATAPVPDVGTKFRVTRRSSYFGEYEEVRCSDGHRVFVHHCRTE